MQVLQDSALGKAMGDKGRETVRQRFLIPRLMEQYLDLFGAFTASFRLTGHL